MAAPDFSLTLPEGRLPLFGAKPNIKKLEGIPQKILLIGGCGSIGSFLFERLLDAGSLVSVCDTMVRGNPCSLPIEPFDYKNLQADDVAVYDAVLWFAGHSSVGQSISDPQGALNNNCLNLFTFARKLRNTTKFIYASTASLYPLDHSLEPLKEDSLITIPSQNAYDISKFAFDYLADHFLSFFYGLRMGTVSGFSRNLRSELIFNAMNLSASERGLVQVKNAGAYRTILFLSDLWRLVAQLLSTDAPSGFYNAGSLTATIGELGRLIADVWGARVVDEGASSTYSFKLDCSKMIRLCGEPQPRLSLADHCISFMNSQKQGRVIE